MKQKRYRIGRIYNTSIWVIIIFLFSYILMKSCIVYLDLNRNKTAAEVTKDIAAGFTNHLIWSSSPLFQYVKSTKDGEEPDNFFVKIINRAFPVNQYADYAWEEKLEKENAAYQDLISYPAWNRDYASNSNTKEDTVMEDVGCDMEAGSEQEDISFIHGESYLEDMVETENKTKAVMSNNLSIIDTLVSKKDIQFLISNFYIVDATTKINPSVFKPSSLLKKDMKLKQDNSKPQILIYHTHSQEAFADSRKGVQGDTVVGVGDYLTDLLVNYYGYNVIHDTGCYDLVHGVLDRSKAYSYSLDAVEKILKKNPTIEVVIDLHRDGVGDKSKRVTKINGKDTAQVMFFNGLSRNKNGAISYLNNPNIVSNLAFSLQLHIKSMEEYPDFTKKIYLKSYRYNLHLKPKSLLIELGTQNSTVSEAKNAMEPLAEILDKVLKGE